MPDRGVDRWLGLQGDGAALGLSLRPETARPDGGMFGGVALGAAIRAAERHTAQPCTWATVQLVRSVTAPRRLDVEVTTRAAGRRSSQVAVTARDADGVAFAAVAATGSGRGPEPGDGPGTLVWSSTPEVPPPDDCPPRFFLAPRGGPLISDALDVRIASGRTLDALDGPSSDGRCALWARIVELDVLDGLGALGVIADHVPFACAEALGTTASGASLDNTIRSIEPHPTRWALLDISFHAVARGLAHATVQVWSAEGTLMAVASQSCRVIQLPVDRDPA